MLKSEEHVTIARRLSIVFHPFVMVGVMVGAAAAARQTAGEAVRTVGTVVLFTIVPLAVLMWRQVRRGQWENADASNRSERPILYAVGGLGVVALLAYVVVFRQQSFMVRGMVATLGMMALSACVTRWIKVSLHMAVATLAATALALGRSPIGYLLLLTLPALGWSRLVLQRHTPLEVVLGTIIGAGAAAALHFL
jgi:membrane-associated phospholipid phosphatase